MSSLYLYNQNYTLKPIPNSTGTEAYNYLLVLHDLRDDNDDDSDVVDDDDDDDDVFVDNDDLQWRSFIITTFKSTWPIFDLMVRQQTAYSLFSTNNAMNAFTNISMSHVTNPPTKNHLPQWMVEAALSFIQIIQPVSSNNAYTIFNPTKPMCMNTFECKTNLYIFTLSNLQHIHSDTRSQNAFVEQMRICSHMAGAIFYDLLQYFTFVLVCWRIITYFCCIIKYP